jgi:hypothetical protein
MIDGAKPRGHGEMPHHSSQKELSLLINLKDRGQDFSPPVRKQTKRSDQNIMNGLYFISVFKSNKLHEDNLKAKEEEGKKSETKRDGKKDGRT